VDFGLDQEQESLRKYAREVLERECGMNFVRAMMEHPTAHDERLHRLLAELGWMGIAIPEAYGGQGLSLVDLAVVVEELGRAVAPGPFFATTCLAAPLILEAGSDEQKETVLPELASGRAIGTVAHVEHGGFRDAGGIALEATANRSGFTISGIKAFVPDAHVADLVVVAARTSRSTYAEEGITLLLIDTTAPGVGVSQRSTLDSTRRLCDIAFDRVEVGPDAVLGEVGRGWPALERALQGAIALLCAECVGGAQRVLELSVEYAKVREQFGRPIGSFQAVKHRCADMLSDVELARSAMYYAAWAASEGAPELALASSMAKAWCGEAYTRVAQNGALLHGGVGFTWEHDLHLYVKRARSNELLLGDSIHHRELVARLVA
jgi:alkylation response protein AidB-like acyl-CoA dehydrogenase